MKSKPAHSFETDTPMRSSVLARATCCVGLLTACAVGSNSDDLTNSSADGSTTFDAAILRDAGQADIDAMVELADAATSDAATSDAATPDAAASDAATSDAATSDAADCVVTTVELLGNGNFDSGAGIWTENSGRSFPVVVDDSTGTGLTADTPSFVAWLGGYSSLSGTATDTLLQDLIIPMNSPPLSFSGKFRIASEETSSSPYDQLKLQILDPVTSSILEELSVWSNEDANAAWETFSGSSTGNYGGQTIRVRFIATMDVSLNTSFFIDSWSATTNSCQ